MLDKVRLAKLLAMTTSDTDPEALSAMRMANAMLMREGMTWEDVLAAGNTLNIVLARTPYRTEENWTPSHRKDTVVIDLMFRTICSTPRDGSGFWAWLDDVQEKWKKHGALTQGQYDSLRKSYNRVKRAS